KPQECLGISRFFDNGRHKKMPQGLGRNLENGILAEEGQFALVFRENSGVDPDGSRKIRVNCPSSAGVSDSLE
ncbi:MAG: hypothetical protein FWC13_11895, partial [Oscillospiraceae bacterium]|nr:hypothetical protein [Oscillospiraceae bacterium]